MFWFMKPKPKLKVGAVARYIYTKHLQLRYLLIVHRQWACPEGATKKQWVYTGTVLYTKGEDIVRGGRAIDIAENCLVYVAGPKVE